MNYGDQIVPIPIQRNNRIESIRLRNEIPINSARICSTPSIGYELNWKFLKDWTTSVIHQIWVEKKIKTEFFVFLVYFWYGACASQMYGAEGPLPLEPSLGHYLSRIPHFGRFRFSADVHFIGAHKQAISIESKCYPKEVCQPILSRGSVSPRFILM